MKAISSTVAGKHVDNPNTENSRRGKSKLNIARFELVIFCSTYKSPNYSATTVVAADTSYFTSFIDKS